MIAFPNLQPLVRELTRALIRELGDQRYYFRGLCLNVGRPSPQVNNIVQRVQRLFAARPGDSSHSSNFLEDDFHWRSGLYARAGKLVDSPFQSILPLEVEVQTLNVARVVELDTVPLASRPLLPLDSFSWAII